MKVWVCYHYRIVHWITEKHILDFNVPVVKVMHQNKAVPNLPLEAEESLAVWAQQSTVLVADLALLTLTLFASRGKIATSLK